MEFGNGKAQVRGMLDTAHSIVVGNGEIDLETGQLNLRVDPMGKGVTLSLATPVVVHGSLWNPEYTVLKGELLVTLTDMTTRAALPPLVLLDAFGDTVAENPCVAFTAGKVPDKGLFNPVESIIGGPGKAVQSVGKAVIEGTEAVVGGIGGSLVEGGAAVLNGVGDVVGSNKPEPERAAAKAPEAPDQPSKRSGKSVESSGKSPEKEETLFQE